MPVETQSLLSFDCLLGNTLHIKRINKEMYNTNTLVARTSICDWTSTKLNQRELGYQAECLNSVYCLCDKWIKYQI